MAETPDDDKAPDNGRQLSIEAFVGGAVHYSNMEQLRTEIAAETGGRWHVTTMTSTYLIDMDDAWAVRVPDGGVVRGDDGTLLISFMYDTDGQALGIVEVIQAEVGQPLRLQVTLPNGQTVPLRSTPIQQIAAI